MSFEQRPKNGALALGAKMTRQRLKLGLGLMCVAGVCGAGLFAYAAAAVQPDLTGAIPVECSQARGKEGADYLRHPDRPICSMPWTTFRRLYPEIAEHTDESSWSG
jgi:hypothetical protein